METTLTALEQFQTLEIELVYRSKVKASERAQICTSTDAYNYYPRPGTKTKLNCLSSSSLYSQTGTIKCWVFMKVQRVV